MLPLFMMKRCLRRSTYTLQAQVLLIYTRQPCKTCRSSEML